MQVISYKKPFDRFIDAIDNEKTKREYVSCLRLFIIHYKVGRWEQIEKQPLRDSESKELISFNSECEELVKLTTEQAEDMIIDYILFMKKEGLSEGIITQRIAACRKFFSSNRINLNWDFINQHKGKFKKKQKSEAYTHQQIQKLLETCDLRTRCIVLIFSSTGIRIGALPELKRSNLKKIGEIYQFTIYENEGEEYMTFCTPECASAIDSYLDYRQRSGESITEDTYLIRREFDSEDVRQVQSESLPISESTIRNIMSKRMVKAGLRKVEHGVNKTHRKEIPIDHGFRKFHSSQLVNSNINTEKRWLLAGQALPKNDDAYIRVKKELYQEYCKAIPLLTIDQTKNQEKIIEKQQQELSQIELLKLEHNHQMKLLLEDKKKGNKQVEQLSAMVQQLAQRMKVLDTLDINGDFSKVINENFELKEMIKLNDNKDLSEIVEEYTEE